ncbi:MAG: hypothetical protein FJ308_03360, partial [Planctomycetes bacterium]|nr:hypothetical protein [Planctomycetota bacterium]
MLQLIPGICRLRRYYRIAVTRELLRTRKIGDHQEEFEIGTSLEGIKRSDMRKLIERCFVATVAFAAACFVGESAIAGYGSSGGSSGGYGSSGGSSGAAYYGVYTGSSGGGSSGGHVGPL